MSQDELQAKHELLIKYVIRMRSYQKRYYAYHTVQDKANMLKYQRLVDKAIADDVADRANPQQKLL